jgi:iron(III) transport system ATP-binding protein
MSAAVELRGVTRRFGSVTAVDRVSCAIEPGKLTCLLGPSGCGKTTLLRLIAGLEMPSDGRVLIGGDDVTNRSAAERDVGMVFQSYALFPHMSVRENVEYGLAALAKAERTKRARAVLQLVGLEGYDDRLPSALSGGQQQRVALARAVVIEPRVLLFDEPLSNLDAKLRRRMRDEIREIQSRLGITAVYVTHDQEEAMAVADRIVVLRDGQIAQCGTPRELYDAPADRFVVDFIGGANLLDCEVIRVEPPLVHLRVGTVPLAIVSPPRAPGSACLAIRPNAVRLLADTAGSGWRGTVRKATWLGSHVEYQVETAAGLLFCIDAEATVPFAPGTPVAVALAERGVALLS